MERADELVVSGPAGTGKSRACLEKLNLMCLLNPGMRALMVRKTHASLTATGLVTWQEKVIPEALRHGVVKYFGGSGQKPGQYQYSNGSVVVVGGMDRATKIMSSEYDLIYVQEATELSENDWEALTTRLRNGKVSFQQLLADCNPDRPTHWLKARADKGACLMLNSRHQDNPLLYTEEGTRTRIGESYLAKLEALTGVRKERLLHGRWSAADGLVYDEYDPAVHLVDRFKIPDTWARWWVVDFGFTNPFVCQWWAEDPDGRLYMYREVYMTQKTVDQHAETIAKQVLKKPVKTTGGAWRGEWKEPKPRAIICDHDAEGQVVLQRELGLPTRNASKKVLEGVQAVQRRLRAADDGKPRLFLMRDSLVERDTLLVESKLPCQTVEEITGYVWEQSGTDRLKEAPKKQDDHGQDCIRYLCSEMETGPKAQIRFFSMR
jgi:phage terminase large subunit